MSGFVKSFFSRITLRKPMHVIVAENDAEKLERTLGLFDLLMIGIGGTVGSGIFATATQIAASTAGPSAVMSWILAGVGCALSGLSFMEMSTRIASSGSTYAYSYHAIGEWAAALAGWLLTLEYGISGAGVARSWANKLVEWIISFGGDVPTALLTTYPDHEERQLGILAALMMLLCVTIVGFGLQIGKPVMNTITMIKIAVVLFIIIAGFSQFHSSNLSPFVPERVPATDDSSAKYGVSGMMLGASQAFFGYIGYDEVCCLSGETKNPIRTMPRAVLGVIIATCFLSVFSTLALVGMSYFETIDPDGGFAKAFREAGLSWAGQIVAAGEVLTMPVVVLISFLAQPRLLFAMAEDGLLPTIFSRIEKNGVLLYGTVISGFLMIIVALGVKFAILWDVISLGILTSFNLTNSCVVMVRYREHSPLLAPSLWFSFIVISLTACMVWQNHVILMDVPTTGAWAGAGVLTVLAFVPVVAMMVLCPQSRDHSPGVFNVPITPVLQTIAVAFNWFLFAQIQFKSLYYFIGYLAIAFIVYMAYGFRYSVGNNTGWKEVLDFTMNHKASFLRGSFQSATGVATPEKMAPDSRGQSYKGAQTPTPHTDAKAV